MHLLDLCKAINFPNYTKASEAFWEIFDFFDMLSPSLFSKGMYREKRTTKLSTSGLDLVRVSLLYGETLSCFVAVPTVN